MDELKIVKLAELRSKMGGIPVKLLVTFLFANLVFWNFSFEKFKEQPGYNIFGFIVLYGVLSYFWLCVKMTGNWIIGIVVAVVLILVMAGAMGNSSGVVQTVLACAVCFGGPVLDTLTVIRYFIIKKQVFSIPRDTYTYAGEQDQEQWQEYSGQQDQEQWQQTQQTRQAQESAPVFFADCKDQASVKRRYRDLCRVYHPDNGNGSPEVFNRITEEYERLMAQYGQA